MAAPMIDEEIVAALAEHRLTTPRQCLCGWRQDGEWSDTAHAEHLLPVVRHIAEQRAAEELLAVGAAIGVKRDAIATDQNGYWVVIGTVGSLVLDRAAALTATPNHGRNATT